MNALNYNHIRFLKSASKCSQLPADEGVEVAFAGRSNSGKSTAINTITRNHHLARVSKTPGRTQLLNFFELTTNCRLVDLPGYGYAKVPNAMRLRWHKTLDQYFSERHSLQGIILLMDIRHPLKPFDQQMIAWSVSRPIAVHILLTKADKLKRGAANTVLFNTENALRTIAPHVSIQLFSSITRLGVESVYQKLNSWLTIPTQELPI